jgi:hypothetical protein
MIVGDGFVFSGPLRMDVHGGRVWRRIDGDDREWEWVGYIQSEDDCPPGEEWAWERLLDIWEDSRRAGEGYRFEVNRTWYDRQSVARMN